MALVLGVAIAIAIAAPARANADDDSVRWVEKGTLVVGIVLGEPTGGAAKWYLKDDQAVQAAVGSAFIGGGLQLHGDYVLHLYLLQSRERYVLPVYVGVRVRLIDDQNGREASSFALRLLLVGGLLFDLAAAKFAAAAPGLTVGVEQGSRSAPPKSG